MPTRAALKAPGGGAGQVMRRAFLGLLLAALLATAASAQSISIKVVATCGALSLNIGPSVGWVLYMDQTGKLCVGATFSGSVTAAPPASAPAAATASAIVTGGVAVTLITGPVNGCYITNPLSATDQNISVAEVAYVNPVTTATANGRGTNSTLQPGQSYSCPPGMTTNLSAIAATTAHAFNVVKW